MEEKKKKARGGSYKEHEEYKKRTRPVSIADMIPVKGPIIEAGMGSARKAAVKMARKLMEKTKGAEKAGRTKRVDKATKESKRFEHSLTDDDKALMELAEMTAKSKKLTPAELREAKTRFMNQRSEQLRPDSFVKVKEKGGKSEVVSYSVPRNKDLMPTSARAKDAARAKSEGFNRLPPASRKRYAEEIKSLSERYGGMDSLDDIGRVLKGHGVKFRRVGDELLITEKVSKNFPTEMFSVKSGDAARVIQYLGY
jgi:hypothetical protein